MAKDKKHTKPEKWVWLQEVYAAEFARFYPSRKYNANDELVEPALHRVREKLRRQPYRYLDFDGVQHENDLSDDFISEARFDLHGSSSAVWEGGIVSSRYVKMSVDAFLSVGALSTGDVTMGVEELSAGDEPERIDGQLAKAPSKQPAPCRRVWHIIPDVEPGSMIEEPGEEPPPLGYPGDAEIYEAWLDRRYAATPKCAASWEVVVPRWEVYAIELLEVPEVAVSAPGVPPPPPKPQLSPKVVIVGELKDRAARVAAGALEPYRSKAALARDLAEWFAGRAQQDDVKPWGEGRIANFLSENKTLIRGLVGFSKPHKKSHKFPKVSQTAL
jgi:hypothetical protein